MQRSNSLGPQYRGLHVASAIWCHMEKITDGKHTRWEVGQKCDDNEQYKLFMNMPHRQPFASYGGYDIYSVDPSPEVASDPVVAP